MSRKAAVVEEFDDDTDLPLPSQPLPDTGARGPLLQAIGDDDDSDDDQSEPSSHRAGPASPSSRSSEFRGPAATGGSGPGLKNTVTDITPYKSWTCIYPIYIDAKRPYGRGQRRIERAKSLWWPLSKDIADAANRLGLGTLHEVNKFHPRDWENPGRVRVQWKKDGRLVNPNIKTKKQLLELICFQLQHLKPENIPKPPYATLSSDAPTPVSKPLVQTATSTTTSSSNKGKQPANAKSKAPPIKSSKKSSGKRVPVPPEPHPPLPSRVSPYSPALSTGVLIETIKAGMNAPENPALGGMPGFPGLPGGVQKGKRKVVRVRG